MPRKRRKRLPEGNFTATIDKLSHEGRGIANIDGKAIFIHNALPGEEVEFHYTFSKSKFAEGQATKIIKASEERAEPPCSHFTICGGCSLQHLSPEAQLAHKQNTLLEHLKHFGDIEFGELMPPVVGDKQGYRNKARLGVRYVPKKGGALVGFRERSSNFLCDMNSCEVLNPQVGKNLEAFRDLIGQLSIPADIAQIELAIGDDKAALIFRNLKPLTNDDKKILQAFGEKYQFEIYLQPKGPKTIHLLNATETSTPLLSYKLPKYDLEMLFHPSDFTQVNMSINRQMIDLAIDLMDVQADDTILDLFCGLGNFTLPLATKAKRVIGVEGSEEMAKRGNMNAKHNNINNAHFYACDLSQDFSNEQWMQLDFEKMLIDPPRSGALEVVQSIAKFGKVKRIVYVSCNPATLARDAGELVKNHGFKLEKVGILDMFPHTSHVESIALLTR
jgi:23S rRNA (uracil1939-C5)-methyltransferase